VSSLTKNPSKKVQNQFDDMEETLDDLK
jgi:solute:Na+ symporter, SSS family